MPSRKGSLNKNKKFLLLRLQEMYGKDFHPIIKMSERAVDLDKLCIDNHDVNHLKAAVDAWDKVAAYTEPKLKAVGVTGRDGADLSLGVYEINFVEKSQD